MKFLISSISIFFMFSAMGNSFVPASFQKASRGKISKKIKKLQKLKDSKIELLDYIEMLQDECIADGDEIGAQEDDTSFLRANAAYTNCQVVVSNIQRSQLDVDEVIEISIVDLQGILSDFYDND